MCVTSISLAVFGFLVMNRLVAFSAVASMSSLSRVEFKAMQQSTARLSSSAVDKLPSEKHPAGNVSEFAL